jgi:hypothetical protein
VKRKLLLCCTIILSLIPIAQAADIYFQDGRVCHDCIYETKKSAWTGKYKLLFAADQTGARYLPSEGQDVVGTHIHIDDPEAVVQQCQGFGNQYYSSSNCTMEKKYK